ncbi:hypothetical protein PABG_07043 [Paracoccidioides brasiliensis Pb03]|nr:hypothetical protein PABG_07043 [Paracoccidioides brasiliensis Pb03]
MTLCPCPRPSAHPRTLLLTLDAFNTLFHPRLPVPVQYAQVAQSLSFPPPQQLTSNNKNLSTEALAEKISVAFRAAFKRESAARPNYGRNVWVWGPEECGTREEHITTAAATESGLRGKIPADIDFIVTSYEADAEKPHRKIFDMAKERAKECLDGGGDSGLSPSGDPEWICVHVGDHYEKDYEGAINAGWDSFLLPRDGEGPSVSDYRLDSSSTVKHIQALTDLFPRLGMDKRLFPVERMM